MRSGDGGHRTSERTDLVSVGGVAGGGRVSHGATDGGISGAPKAYRIPGSVVADSSDVPRGRQG